MGTETELARDPATSRQPGGDCATAETRDASGGTFTESSLAKELSGHASSGIGARSGVAVFRGVGLRSALSARLRLARLRPGRR